MNLKELKEIFRLIEKTDFTEVEIQKDDLSIKVNRASKNPIQKSLGRSVQHEDYIHELSAADLKAKSEETVLKSKKIDPSKVITSPFVGTFYTAPSPDSDAYVKVGDKVKSGQIVCIVEAMKLMNELESELDGVIKEILIKDGQPVEFGENLFLLE